jgi:hypothetical protein
LEDPNFFISGFSISARLKAFEGFRVSWEYL